MSFANFVQAQLAEPLTINGVSITLAPAVAPNQLPPVDGGVVILADSLGKPTFVEIIRYSSRDGQILNGVTRAQEGTAARAWPAGSQCYQSLTAGEFGAVQALVTEHVAADNPHPQYTTPAEAANAAPVQSVAGQTGTVTLEQLRAAGVATQDGAETLNNKTVSGPRASMAQYIDQTVTNGAATGTVTLDLSAADVFDLTLSGNTTLAFSNAPALSGETFTIVVRVRQGSTARTLAWWGGIVWLATSTPAAPAANKIVEYILSTTNGTAWLGRKGAAN